MKMSKLLHPFRYPKGKNRYKEVKKEIRDAKKNQKAFRKELDRWGEEVPADPDAKVNKRRTFK